jgi:cupin fold WbuC family metalloprotein
MNQLTLIDGNLLDSLSAAAKVSPRKRMNRNFHPHNEFPGHRLLIAIEPDSYVPPHRHLDQNKAETLIVLRGRIGLVVFDDAGSATQCVVLQPVDAALGVDIPHGIYHTIVALEENTVFMEAKAGPYVPVSDAERAPWAPTEADSAVPTYLEDLRYLFS